jgi:hypothetical protein
MCAQTLNRRKALFLHIKAVMNPMKALGWMVMLAVFCCHTLGDDLTITSPTMIEMPPLEPLPSRLQLYGAVGTSGTNAAFVWNSAASDGTTNLYLTRLNEFGSAIKTPPWLVAPAFYISAYPELYPAEGGYFLRYFDRPNRSGPSRLLLKGIDFDGNQVFAPLVITTNSFKESDTASNGRSLLLLVENYRTAGIKLDYTLVSASGGILSTGVLEGASGGHSFAATTNGAELVAVWSASSSPHLRFTRISENGASVRTAGVPDKSIFVQAVAHGKNGYLVAGGASLMQLNEEGAFVAQTGISDFGLTPQQELLVAEDEGWILFAYDSAGHLRNFRVTPTAGGLRVADIAVYPTVSGLRPNATVAPTLVSEMAPFGPGRFLIVRTNGVSLLTKSGVNDVGYPLNYAQQSDSHIVSSPFGFLAVWKERRGDFYPIRILRFAPDGSPLDDESFEIGEVFSERSGSPQLLFDGKDYIVEWAISDPMVARISPLGEPDLRIQTYSIDSIYAPEVRITAHQGELFASFSSGNVSAPLLLMWKLGPDGQVGPEIGVHGFYLVSDGAKLFSLGVNDKFEVFKIALDLAAQNPEISTNIIGSSPTARALQLRHGFVAEWSPAQGRSFAYFSNGQERLRANRPANAATAFADTEDRLLMVSLPPQGGHTYKFDSFNLNSGSRSFIQVDLGNVTHVDLAGGNTDFLATTDSSNAEMKYVGKFWVTTAKAPSFSAPRIEPNFVTTSLNLDPKRRYRIEASSDLMNWNLQQVVSGSPAANVTLANIMQGFIRAVLVPE